VPAAPATAPCAPAAALAPAKLEGVPAAPGAPTCTPDCMPCLLDAQAPNNAGAIPETNKVHIRAPCCREQLERIPTFRRCAETVLIGCRLSSVLQEQFICVIFDSLRSVRREAAGGVVCLMRVT